MYTTYYCIFIFVWSVYIYTAYSACFLPPLSLDNMFRGHKCMLYSEVICFCLWKTSSCQPSLTPVTHTSSNK
uniref:Uncharacterized protein n=1 Tax=Anguilla anguilla TaxID=7936 RepID=A0A0E9Q028_ANGAN